MCKKARFDCDLLGLNIVFEPLPHNVLKIFQELELGYINESSWPKSL